MPNLISLQNPMAGDSLELTILKNTFNRLATQINMLWNTLSLEEKQELYAKLKAIEEQIYSFG